MPEEFISNIESLAEKMVCPVEKWNEIKILLFTVKNFLEKENKKPKNFENATTRIKRFIDNLFPCQNTPGFRLGMNGSLERSRA